MMGGDPMLTVLRAVSDLNSLGVVPDTDQVFEITDLPTPVSVTNHLIELCSLEFTRGERDGTVFKWLVTDQGSRLLAQEIKV